MQALRSRYRRDDGWTFVEATLSIVIMAIMVLGLTIVLLAFREQLDRSWAVRVMDQYGNDVIEQLTHELRNATEVTVRTSVGNTNRIDVKYLDPIRHNMYRTAQWRADLRNVRIERNSDPIDPTFPPKSLGRGESYEITRFTMTKYGAANDAPFWEKQDAARRKDSFVDAAWDIKFNLRYNRNAIEANERNWSVEREYYNRVYIRNMNLVVKKGITE